MLYIIGVGPGDRELLTLKAVRVLKKAAVIYYPSTISSRDNLGKKNGLALEIVKEFIDRKKQKVRPLPFVMRKKDAAQKEAYKKNIEVLVKDLKKGREVAFITLGDPGFFSTYKTLADSLSEVYQEVKIEIIPGVTSFSAASASTLIPLVKRDECIAIIPAVYNQEKIRQTLKNFDTIIFLKIDRVYPKIFKILKELRLLRRTTFIEHCSTEDERIIRDITGLRNEEINYFSLLIVKK